jgi:hypothetical protein
MVIINNYKYTAFDTINKKPINLWKIVVAKSGKILGVESLEGELYGMHQIELTGKPDDN